MTVAGGRLDVVTWNVRRWKRDGWVRGLAALHNVFQPQVIFAQERAAPASAWNSVQQNLGGYTMYGNPACPHDTAILISATWGVEVLEKYYHRYGMALVASDGVGAKWLLGSLHLPTGGSDTHYEQVCV